MAVPSGSTLRLPTPGVPSALDASSGMLPLFGTSPGDAGLEAQQLASAAFAFPYAAAYPMQIDLMRAIFRAIEAAQVGVFESPTGTVSAGQTMDRGRASWLTLGARASRSASSVLPSPGCASTRPAQARAWRLARQMQRVST
jgi:hypothetical protein